LPNLRERNVLVVTRATGSGLGATGCTGARGGFDVALDDAAARPRALQLAEVHSPFRSEAPGERGRANLAAVVARRRAAWLRRCDWRRGGGSLRRRRCGRLC